MDGLAAAASLPDASHTHKSRVLQVLRRPKGDCWNGPCGLTPTVSLAHIVTHGITAPHRGLLPSTGRDTNSTSTSPKIK